VGNIDAFDMPLELSKSGLDNSECGTGTCPIK
jgi:hypothetical protein